MKCAISGDRKQMKRGILTAIAVAATMATVPALHAQVVTTQPGVRTGMHNGARHEQMMEQLGLTASQKAQVKAIHAKYEPQIKAERERMRPQMEAARAARAKGDTAAAHADRANLRTSMEPMRKIHEQEMAEVRAILTPAQQAKFDAMKQRHGGTTRGNGMKMGRKA